MNQTEMKAEVIEHETLDRISLLFSASVSAMLKKYAKTLKQVERLEEQGDFKRARVLMRTSGMLDDLAIAIAQAGQVSAEMIRDERAKILEVVNREDNGEKA